MATLSRWQTSMGFPSIICCAGQRTGSRSTPLTELHLNDEMVALLKSGQINNRLLCELATHKDFIKFLADIEIYVDGIATMQIKISTPLLIPSGMKLLNGIAPAKMTRI